MVILLSPIAPSLTVWKGQLVTSTIKEWMLLMQFSSVFSLHLPPSLVVTITMTWSLRAASPPVSKLSVLLGSVLRPHPDLAGVPCPAVPALTAATVAQAVPCEEEVRRKAVNWKLHRGARPLTRFLFSHSASPGADLRWRWVWWWRRLRVALFRTVCGFPNVSANNANRERKAFLKPSLNHCWAKISWRRLFVSLQIS